MVFYAGRRFFLTALFGYIAHRCKRPITLVTGSDAAALGAYPGPGSIITAPLADPDVLDSDRNPARASYQRFIQEFSGHFNAADVRSGWTIMAHDAVLTAAQAIRRTAGPGGGAALAPARVRDMLYTQHATNRVLGASGDIDMGPTGNPVHRLMSVIEIAPSGRHTVLDVHLS
jgi:hypothetical protein